MPAGSISVPRIIPLRIPHGHRKHVINSFTPLEIRTDSKNCLLFYTLNNKTPNPFQSHGNKYTYQYERPFTLAPGKVIVKAMALSSDGYKQSLVVTKTFVVQEGGGDEGQMDLNIQKVRSCPPDLEKSLSPSPLNETSLSQQFRERLRLSSRESTWREGSSSPVPHLSLSRSPTPHPPSRSPPHSPSYLGHSPFLGRSSPVPHNSVPTYIPRVHSLQPPHHGHCTYCSATITRPDDIYCTGCGHQLPSLPKPMRAATRMAVCGSCRAEVVFGSGICPVCDSKMKQPDPLPNILAQPDKPQESCCCLHCGTHNAVDMRQCLTCDMPLPHPPGDEAVKVAVAESKDTVMHPITGSTYLMCGTCGRVNVSDARYCDWCGSRPVESTVQLSCQSCNSANDWRARFCYKCGELMKCPLRPEVETGETLHMPKGSKMDRYKWVPIADIIIHKEDKSVTVWPEVRHKSTQTSGQYYPSARTIDNRVQSETIKKQVKETTTQDRIPQLSLFSSGRGLIRNQINHLCNHLKAYTSGSKEFQDSIADYELGKLIKGEAEEDLTNSQLILHLTFNFKTDNDATIASYPPPIIRGISGNTNRAPSKRSLNRQTSFSVKVEDYLLAAELSSQGREDIVSSLIEKGADVNGTDTTHGIPMLLLAVTNGHIDSMNTLIAHGVTLNVQDKKTGNTALHEAVTARHLLKEDMIKTLMSHGANPDMRNKKMMKPSDLAAEQDLEYLLPLLSHASHQSDSLTS